MEDAPKNEVIPQENTNTEARPQQSRFAALLKSHPCTDYIYIYIYIYVCIYYTACIPQKMKFSIKDFFTKRVTLLKSHC